MNTDTKSDQPKSPALTITSARSTQLPVSKRWLVDGFCGYTRRMIRSRFTAFGVSRSGRQAVEGTINQSFVAYANHIGWWDPIVAMHLKRAYFPNHTLYAPIDASALAKYRVLSQMGFYGIEMGSYQGAADFLRTTQQILHSRKNSIWMTPEGRFCDCRDRSQSLMSGLSHVASKSLNNLFIPIAIEYPFWDEPRPLILAKFGEPMQFSSALDKEECMIRLEGGLRQTQDELALAVIARDYAAFEFIVPPKAQRLTWYDYFRSWSARLRGQPFDPRHSAPDES